MYISFYIKIYTADDSKWINYIWEDCKGSTQFVFSLSRRKTKDL